MQKTFMMVFMLLDYFMFMIYNSVAYLHSNVD